ncbi:MAG: UDP-N-acetylmuramoyl-L-alanine--D-glutamate ligase [Thermoflexales bacterium]|nr:UDP-N-acetylmuramoyl-L-alanine--D-glutamate ligase [Thermoflexales bacterium]
MDWRGRRVLVLGAARQGLATTRYLLACGALVTLSDAKPAAALDLSSLGAAGPGVLRLALGGHPLELLDGCDLVCLSGGVPIDLPIVLAARARGLALSNDAQLFFEACPAPIIGITGSAGKTTTTTLTGEMLRASAAAAGGPAVHVGGNIGNPLIEQVDGIGAADKVVMELSSFQLDLMTRSPHIAAITNITPNHLDRHGTMDAYAAAKRRILDFQGPDDHAVLSADDPLSATLHPAGARLTFSLTRPPEGDGAWLDRNGDLQLRLHARGIEARICARREIVLMGDHNVRNVLAAALLGALGGASLEAIRRVAVSFKGVAHRLQLIREWRGARFYNDSIATAPERVLADLRCFEVPIVLMVGGRDKKLPWEEVAAEMVRRCRHVVLFGEMGGMVAGKLTTAGLPAGRMSVCDTLDRAVARASEIVHPGDVALLSPGGTSYDAYRDFEQRGEHFRALVDALT